MKQFIEKIKIETEGNQIININDKVNDLLFKSRINNGILNLSILHTSCSLMVQENADPTVMVDIKNFLNKMAPENEYFHNSEGPDDMPAHLKSLITQTNLTLSVKDKNLILGCWQGIFLLEHRYSKKIREVLFHLLGE